ncbi:MAG TPA: M28 family peptidase [Blastocatellia bacterium]|nr:M28 family peptidase [Blastocatellia bacterium]
MPRRLHRSLLAGNLSVVLAFALLCQPLALSQKRGAAIPLKNKAVLDRISADSLRGHLSFIASDLLEGRDTPSRGLDVAAEYIAAQFRRAGLEAVGDDGYFQTANWTQMVPNPQGFALTITSDNRQFSVSDQRVSMAYDQGLNLKDAGIVKVDFNDSAALAALTEAQVSGRVVMTEIPDFRREERARAMQIFQAMGEFRNRMQTLRAALIVSLDRSGSIGTGVSTRRLINPDNPQGQGRMQNVPILMLHDAQAARLFDELKPGQTDAKLSFNAPPAIEKPVKLRNVIGLLRGSDPVLKDTYVMVTAHYDHVGIRSGGAGDNIFNGANDDGSGTVSVIELAAALATRKPRPKRSIVFMTVFGEEKGLLGSRYYGKHPVFPIEKTVADINLEQVGRTDSTEGPQLSNATLTGFDFTDLGPIFKAAGKLTGINVYKHEQNSDLYFGRSDNQALADQGVPAHTLCVAFEYPDYHGAGDHWDKIDYENMAKVNRMVALALLMLADSQQAPKWNEANPKTAKYVTAWKKRHPTEPDK